MTHANSRQDLDDLHQLTTELQSLLEDGQNLHRRAQALLHKIKMKQALEKVAAAEQT